MRKGQLIKLLIKAYNSHINHLKENYQNAPYTEVVRYLEDNYIDCGVCYFIRWGNYTRKKFEGKSNAGYGAEWVRKYYSKGEPQWAPYPSKAYTLSSVIRILQFRVSILEKELASGDKLHQRVTSKNYYSKNY